MTVTILIDEYTLPPKGSVELNICRSFEINVSVEEARRNVNTWLLEEVSYMVGAGEPVLVVGTDIVWRVPALLSASHIGEVGTVGVIEVDVQNGEMDISPELKAEILHRAQQLADNMPPYAPRKDSPVSHLAEDIQASQIRPNGDPRQIIAATQ